MTSHSVLHTLRLVEDRIAETTEESEEAIIGQSQTRRFFKHRAFLTELAADLYLFYYNGGYDNE